MDKKMLKEVETIALQSCMCVISYGYRFTSFFIWHFPLLGKGHIYCPERSDVGYWTVLGS